MTIYNPFKKEMYAKKLPIFWNFWIESVYEHSICEYEYDIYLCDDRELVELVYVIKDETLSKRLFHMIKGLKDVGEISLEYYNISIRKIVIDRKENKLLAFHMYMSKKNPDAHLSDLEKLIEFTTFVGKMNEMNFVLAEEFCNLNSYCSFFELLFWFDEGEGENATIVNTGLLLDFICHKVYGGSLEDLYNTIRKNFSFEMKNVSFSFDMLRMFYQFYQNNKLEKDVLEVLKSEKADEEYKEYYHEYNMKLIPSLEDFQKGQKVLKETESYIVYGEENETQYKLYTTPDQTVYENIRFLYDIYELSRFVKFKITGMLFDFDCNFIGYEYCETSFCKLLPIKEGKREDLSGLVTWLWNLKRFVSSIPSGFSKSSGDNTFDIENDVSYSMNSMTTMYFTDDESFIRGLSCPTEVLKNQLGNFALKLYSNYLASQYNGLESMTLDALYELFEIKILPPKFTLELCHFILGQKVDMGSVYYSFFQDFPSNYQQGKNKKELYIYYSKFIYDPLKTEYIFEEQVKDLFGIEVSYGTEHVLDDGRVICLFKGKRELKNFAKVVDSNEEKYSQFFSYDDSDIIHKIGLHTIIYSKKISNDDTYYMIGYVSDPIKGELLSELDFSKISNKDFIKIAANLFVRFNKRYIGFCSIRMDKDFHFYINMLDNITVNKTSGRNFAEDLLSRIVPINGLEDDIVRNINFSSRRSLNMLYESMDAFCDAHNVYYPSSDGLCPICQRTIYDVEKYKGKFGKIIFEDEYAIHYALTVDKNLKVYKEDKIDIREQEQNIDSYLKNRPNLGQDMFLPYKKAVIASSRKFIGYVYEKVDFSECLDLDKDFKNLKKLKALITLGTQVLHLEYARFFFSHNPFGKALFNPSHKKMIQIVNVDFLNFNQDGGQEICNFSETFIVNYIHSIISNEIDTEDINAISLADLIDQIKELARNMTKYCPVHDIYYHKKYLLCPKCVPNFNPSVLQENSISFPVDQWMKERKPKNEGGESYIYEYEDGVFAKIFKLDEVNIEMKVAIIIKILERRDILERLNTENSKFVFVTPQKFIIDSETNSVRGYILNEVKGVSISTLRDEALVQKLGLEIQDILEILITAGEGIEYLHKKANMYIGDLNGRNILFDENKTIYFLDFDGMGIDDIAPLFFTDGYVDPIAKNNQTISMKDDWYSFAIQAFYYLTLTHPFEGIYYDKDKKRNLDIDEKMELRISLLGKHGIKPPSLARSWEWMKGEIEETFLSIFEGDERVNITPYLKNYYNSIASSKYVGCADLSSFTDTFSTSKTVTREIVVFEENFNKIINSISYISIDENGNQTVNICVNKEIHKFGILGDEKVIDIILSESKEMALIVFERSICMISLSNDEEIFKSNLNMAPKVAINGHTLYFASVIDYENVIIKAEFAGGVLTKKTVIKFQTQMYTKSFFVLNNEKFVIVKEGDHEDYIFCNDIRYLSIPRSDSDVEYSVLYDKVRNEWLVINTEGVCVVIRNNGKHIQFEDRRVVGCNIRKVKFENGNIYIPEDGGIYIINTKKSKEKYIECNVIESKSCIVIKKKGFYIFNDDRVYEYVKIK
ncbi:MAG: hypothetical protein Q4D02_02840 [Clostridia bacterium]|nr:hypothetical protein [Clostridia bacterium]